MQLEKYSITKNFAECDNVSSEILQYFAACWWWSVLQSQQRVQNIQSCTLATQQSFNNYSVIKSCDQLYEDTTLFTLQNVSIWLCGDF